MNQEQNRNSRGANIFGNDDLNFNSDPRKESFFSFLKWFFCPRFKAFSLTFFIFLANLAMFIFLLTRGIKTSAIPNLSFLAIDESQFQGMGSLTYSLVRNGEVYRLITHAFLHADLAHLTLNSISLIILGSIVETILGSGKFSILYLISGIGGGLFYILIDKSGQTVGASGAIFGLLGAYIAFHLINWNYISDLIGPTRAMINILFLIILVLLGFSMQVSNKLINTYGHLGGFLNGFFLFPIICKPVQENDGALCSYKMWFIVCLVIEFAFLIAGFLVVFLAIIKLFQRNLRQDYNLLIEKIITFLYQ